MQLHSHQVVHYQCYLECNVSKYTRPTRSCWDSFDHIFHCVWSSNPNSCRYILLFQLAFFTVAEHIVQVRHPVIQDKLLYMRVLKVVYVDLFYHLLSINCLVEYTLILRVLLISPSCNYLLSFWQSNIAPNSVPYTALVSFHIDFPSQ